MSEEHEVQDGECIETIAEERGFFPETVWNHSENSELRENRTSMNLLVPGDIVIIPDKELKEESCATEAKHSFKRKGVPSRFKVRYIDEEGAPIAGAKFRTVIDDLFGPEGKTDQDGYVDIPVPPGALNLTIFVDTEVQWAKKNEFVLSSLEPVTTIAGVQSRLQSLGFYDGEIDGENTKRLRKAVRAFQRTEEIEVTGDPTSKEVQDAIKKLYGC